MAETPAPRPSFWQGQWAPQPTGWQIAFDALFGVIAPLATVYTGSHDPCNTIMWSAPLYAYVVMGLGITMLAVWLTVGQRLPSGFGPVFCVFFAGAGLVSVLLTPFWACFSLLPAAVYWRNCVRALRYTRVQSPSLSVRRVMAIAGGSAVLLVTIAAIGHWRYSAQFSSIAIQNAKDCVVI